LYEETFEEERYPKQIVSPDETLQIEQQVFDEKANKEVLKPKKETVKKTVAKGEEFVVKKVEEQTTQTIDNTTGEVVEEEEVVVEDVVIEEEIVEDKVVEETKSTPNADDDWLKGF
jgi:membrane glycosyltransferase